jgi:hypothetical protein
MQKIKHILVILVLILPLALSIIACDDEDGDGDVSIGREACFAACSTQYERGSDNWHSCTSLCPPD